MALMAKIIRDAIPEVPWVAEHQFALIEVLARSCRNHYTPLPSPLLSVRDISSLYRTSADEAAAVAWRARALIP